MIKVEYNKVFKLIEIEDSFESMILTLNQSFKALPSQLSWTDGDGDSIQIASQKDWEIYQKVNTKLPKLLYTPKSTLNPAAVTFTPQVPVVRVPEPWSRPTGRQNHVALPRMNSRFVSHVTANDAVYAPGTRFRHTWLFRNEGGLVWTHVEIEFNSKLTGDQMGGPDTMPICKRVAVGEEAAVSVPLIAPPKEGEYSGHWKLHENGKRFGQRVNVRIQVKKPTPPTETERALLDQLEGYEEARDTALLLIQEGCTAASLEERLARMGIYQSLN